MSDFKSRQKLSWEGMFYSMQRIDLLLVSISSAGIYVILETVKFLVEEKFKIGVELKISGIAFIFAIIINFLSQLFGYKANEQDYLMCELNCIDKPNKKDLDKIKEHDKKSAFFSKWTNKLNYISMVFLAIGLFSLLYFYLITF
jgi:hypothetical protein